MAPTRTLKMAHMVYGLAHKDGKLFISDEAETVYIYDMNGVELRKISTDGSGKHVFQNNQQIAISAHGDRVFVADFLRGLVVLDGEGNYLFTDNSKTGCRGVCTDGKNIFVCSTISNDIVQFDNKIKLLGSLGRFGTPVSLCFDHRNGRLVVSLYSNNNIKILELEL
jgi:DNA-binding beta-propeller fold protein YncE